MTARAFATLAIACSLSTSNGTAFAQSGRHPQAQTAPNAQSNADPQKTDLRARFGLELATRLMVSDDHAAKLRGIARAASVGTPEAISIVAQAMEPAGFARNDSRALIAVARGLAPFADQLAARSALALIVNLPTPSRSSVVERSAIVVNNFDSEQTERFELARETAAIALCRSGNPSALDLVIPIAQGAGPGHHAANLALAAFPPEKLGSLEGSPLSLPSALRFMQDLSDLRTLDAIIAAARSNEPPTRAAALIALGRLGDGRAMGLARSAASDRDATVRAAAAETLVLLDAPEKNRVVQSLLEDDATTLAGARLAERVDGPTIVRALAARAVSTRVSSIRTATIAALGRSSDPDSVRALAELLKYPLAQGDAASALARSPCPAAMSAIESLLAEGGLIGRLGVRAYVVRAILRGERSNVAMTAIERQRRSSDRASRQVGAFALVALGKEELSDFLSDRDPRIRRAAAMASVASMNATTALTVFSPDLSARDPEAHLTTQALVRRAQSGGSDAPIAAMVLAQRADTTRDGTVVRLLAARDPLLRAHTARGLAHSSDESATGRLADAYAYETTSEVRRAIIVALALRGEAPSRHETLDLASRLDPDAQVRFLAGRALSARDVVLRSAVVPEVAWLRLTTVDGEKPLSEMTASLVLSNGLAIPIAFDDDGYALVPGVPPGDTRLVLASGTALDEASSP